MSDPIRRQTLLSESSLDRLLNAAVAELQVSGYASLTIRQVARRAGMSTATAYNYFSSKEHLFAALHLRMVRALPRVVADERPVEQRLAALVQDLADALGPEPELQEAFRAALLGNNPDSRRVREAIIEEFVARFHAACGEELAESARDAILLSFVGAMVMAGVGESGFSGIGERIASVVRLVR